MTDRNLREETFYREMRLDASAIDSEARTVPASLSSELPVQRWFGTEVLAHTKDAVNLERASGGLPLLWQHDPHQPIGVVKEVKLDGSKLRGVLHFSRNAKAAEVFQDVRDGFLANISIGYRIDEEARKAGSDLVTATRWTLMESSIVSVPADPTVGINRKQPGEGTRMTDTTTTAAPAATAAPTTQPAEVAGNLRLVQGAAREDGIRIERARVAAIRELFVLDAFRQPEHLALCDQAINEGWTKERTSDELLRMIGAGIAPVAGTAAPQRDAVGGGQRGSTRPAFVQPGRDQAEAYRAGALQWLLVRSGIVVDKAEVAKLDQSEFRGMTLIELAREHLRRSGIDVRGMSKSTLVGAALTRGMFTVGHTTSDFANVLVDAAQKSLVLGYQEAPETWPIWTKAVPLSDFKAHNRIKFSTFSDLDTIPEGGEYKYGTFSDAKETLTLKTMGKLFSITRQAIINDDQSAFTDIPRHMGRAASRMVGDDVYAITSGAGPTMSDGIALFHASSHGANLITTGAAPSVSTLNVGYKTMALQQDEASNVLNIMPKFLLVARGLEMSSRALVASTYDPAGTAGTLTPNPWKDRLTVVGEARLDAIASGLPWFLTADPNMFPTVEIGFLDGNQEPYLEQQEHFTQDGVAFKVRLDFVAGAIAYQGMFQNDGA